MRVLIRPRLPVVALLLLAPSIPELLTGSTPVSRLFYDPALFAVGYLGDIALYGTGALLIREFSVVLRKGWASVLLWGAAYGVTEEGLAVHTFFERSGPPVGALATYGSAYGFNGLWALGLTVFHATYSIALPILLTYLWFPETQGRRWLDRGLLVVVGTIYLGMVALFAATTPYAPGPPLLAAMLSLEALLLAAGMLAPPSLIRARSGLSAVGPWGLVGAGSLEWWAWLAVLALSGGRAVPAVATGAGLVLVDGAALGVIFLGVGSADLEWSKFAFAVGMLVPLLLWAGLLEFAIPGLLAVAVLFAFLLYRLGRTLSRRDTKGIGGRPAGG